MSAAFALQLESRLYGAVSGRTEPRKPDGAPATLPGSNFFWFDRAPGDRAVPMLGRTQST